MNIEFLVEDLSTAEALDQLLPKILPIGTEYKIHSFRGKQDLLAKLLSRLKGYASGIPEDWRIVILIDRDDEDCHKLKQQLDQTSQEAGLIAKTKPLSRIMIEELEAWNYSI